MIKKAKQPSFTYNIPALAKTTKVSVLFFYRINRLYRFSHFNKKDGNRFQDYTKFVL